MSHKIESSHAIRILMVVPLFPMPVWGGLEKQAYLLAKALAEDGHKVIIMARRFHAGQKAVEQVHGFEVIRLSYGPGVLRILDAIFHLRIPFFMFSRRTEFDIVHIHAVNMAGLIALLTARMLGKKILQKIPGVGVCRISESWKTMFGAIRGRVFRSSADAIVAMSENCVRAVKSVGYPESRVFRITNGVATENGVPRVLGSVEERLKIIFLGRLALNKGILDLLDAWKIVISGCGNVAAELNIFGQGPMESQIKKTIAVKFLDGSVNLCGHTNDVQSALAAADILVLPSYEEGNSNSVLEAMAAGLPIASTKVGGTANLVGDAGRAFLYEPGDIRTLSEILIQLIRDRKMRLETGIRMRERILNHFSITKIKDKYVLAYRMLVEEKRDEIWNCSEYPPD
jgi:glycosyltransferase involved in cell wall biosynthesis